MKRVANKIKMYLSSSPLMGRIFVAGIVVAKATVAAAHTNGN
jgi:hypothetical protein